ncbi:MAG: hypothetical protein ACLUE2_18280 [Bacteroides cellulosilyticus]
MWECGLKQGETEFVGDRYVSLLMWGVWIETHIADYLTGNMLSLLMWECGLKRAM